VVEKKSDASQFLLLSTIGHFSLLPLIFTSAGNLVLTVCNLFKVKQVTVQDSNNANTMVFALFECTVVAIVMTVLCLSIKSCKWQRIRLC